MDVVTNTFCAGGNLLGDGSACLSSTDLSVLPLIPVRCSVDQRRWESGHHLRRSLHQQHCRGFVQGQGRPECCQVRHANRADRSIC